MKLGSMHEKEHMIVVFQSLVSSHLKHFLIMTKELEPGPFRATI